MWAGNDTIVHECRVPIMQGSFTSCCRQYYWIYISSNLGLDSPREIVTKRTNAAKAAARPSVRYPGCIIGGPSFALNSRFVAFFSST